MNVVIFGATGPTGRLVLSQGLKEDTSDQFTAVARRPEAIEFQHERLRVVRGDVFDAASVEQAIAGHDAVIAVFGGRYTFKPVNIYSIGIQHIIAAMEKHGVRRLLGVTSRGTNPRYDPEEGFVFGRIIKPIIGRTLYADMRRMESAMMASSLDWTVVRPARLIDTPDVGVYKVESGYVLSGGSQTSRTDLADFLLQAVHNNEYVKEAVTIATYKNGSR